MPLTNRSVGAAVAGIVSLILTCSNPNFELKDVSSPIRVVNKIKNNDDYSKSGIAYNISYGIFLASILGLGYNALTENFVRKRKENNQNSG